MKKPRTGGRKPDEMRPYFASSGYGLLACGFVVLFPLLLSGCNVVGAVAHVVGPPDVQPLYVPEKTPMLVLAENYADMSGTTVDGEQLERFVIEELQVHDVAPIADCDKVYTLRAAEPQQYRRQSIDQLGRIAGAAQVLYINLHS